jgi:hypothetical protein
MRNS